MASPDWAEYVYADLATGGFNKGGARDRIIEVLGDQECALSVTEIEGELREQGWSTARASVYRVLDLLVARGLVERLVVGNGEARFEALEPSGDHHHHLVCDQCGRLVAFDDEGLELAINRLSERLSVTVESHDVILRGACDRCQ
jgi:Fur family transcriptional regulator, ferric uptake regulator